MNIYVIIFIVNFVLYVMFDDMNKIELNDIVFFIVAFWVLHEVTEKDRYK